MVTAVYTPPYEAVNVLPASPLRAGCDSEHDKVLEVNTSFT
jgi:hypothetical protein